ncbi:MULTISPECIES: hypothetical protein [unclassified Kaistella]|uniref:hypothetical protein n=1 Tax=unclassified Kaistella TaxID=2762626 RepID=UPI0027364028|nr:MULTISPECIES: hypothetical protein [unclassified Kaistella]MDP2452642.1 hypothetical protein [Kaistella sp. SH11-4b]MDP2455551.1 hypothetical protein [Kaistella sp. SH40-3]MDP2458455.1 hypothetical protein [Kaistella sp. SH19-2b]
MRDESGKFTKGNNLGGRTKGAKNKVTQNIRDTFLYFINDNLETLQSDFDQLDAAARFKIIFDFAKFVIPTVKTVSFGDVLEEMSESEFNRVVEQIRAEYSKN